MGGIVISKSIINMWIIMAFLISFSLIVYINIKIGRFKTVPETKFQALVEAFVEFLYNSVRDIMGERNLGLAPYIGSLTLLILFSNLSGLFAFKKIPTTDYSITLGFAIATFFIVQYHQFKYHGVKGYFKELVEPNPAFLLLHIIDKFVPVLSMSLRLFGNVTAGFIVMELLYEFLRGMNIAAMALIPVPFHFYFDIFDAGLQALVFAMLTMILTANATNIDEH